MKIFNYKKFHFAIEDFYLIIALFCLLKSIININTKKITIKDIVLIALIISFLICWRFITKTFKRTIPHNIPILGAGGSFSFDSYLEWMILFMALMFGRRGVFIAMLIYSLVFVWIYPSWFLGGVANNPNSTLWYAFLIYVFKYIIPYLACALVTKRKRLYLSIANFLFICLIYTLSNSIAGYIFNGKLDLMVSKWEFKYILLLTLIQQSIRNSLFMVVGIII
ncbi:MAG: hypothetical protein E7Y34_02630, partial [Mycoplasma sp.]|nr:hypothetical protein [Mycoplasma sp.]